MDKKRNNTRKLKISKGYRLKPSTHNLIKRFQKILNINQDKVISKALQLLKKETIN